MNVRPYILATAGHVDHGKSTLVRALTGTDPDRLPEEKARAITIDLGFASLRLPAPNDAELHVGIIDVPGHEDFIKNMISGIGAIDAALLVVAADDGWMPQTEEHLQILEYLGIERGVVAVTKADLAGDLTQFFRDIGAQLRGTCFAQAPLLAVSATTGAGLDDLRAALGNLLSQSHTQADMGKPRLAVDRVFTLRGAGTIVTGTLTGGTLRRGQALAIGPGARSARVRTLQSFGTNVDTATPGSRTAINLPDLHPARGGGATVAPNEIARGDIVTLPGLGRTTSTVDVILWRSPRSTGPSVLQHGSAVTVQWGSTLAAARLRFAAGQTLSPGEQVPARLALDRALHLLVGDRLVLRDSSARLTLAGTVVLDPSPAHPSRSLRRDASQLEFLSRFDRGPLNPQEFIAAIVARDAVLPRQTLDELTPFASRDIDRSLQQLQASGLVSVIAHALLHQPTVLQLKTLIASAVDTYHKDHPEQRGLRLSQLLPLLTRAVRPAYRPALKLDDLLQALLQQMEEIGIAEGAVFRLTHQPGLPPRLQLAGQSLRAKLSQGFLDPPSRNDLCPDDRSRQALGFLIASGEAVELSPAIVISRDAYSRAISAVRAYLTQHPRATVSDIKTHLGSSRRIIVPLLERLDRDGITHRDGDHRALRPPAK